MKKITYKELATLLGYKKNHPFQRIACNHYIEEEEYDVRVISQIKWPVYIVLFIPSCILQAVALMWDGGLKNNFCIEPRTTLNYAVWKDSERYKKFAEMT